MVLSRCLGAHCQNLHGDAIFQKSDPPEACTFFNPCLGGVQKLTEITKIKKGMSLFKILARRRPAPPPLHAWGVQKLTDQNRKRHVTFQKSDPPKVYTRTRNLQTFEFLIKKTYLWFFEIVDFRNFQESKVSVYFLFFETLSFWNFETLNRLAQASPGQVRRD